MQLTQLEYFVALARERHFGRAATACYVSQSTLSESIRKLEVELDVPLVKRGHSFEGLTAEGEQLLIWARRMVADQQALKDAVAALRTGLVGTLRLGVIPTAIESAAKIVDRFCAEHPLAQVDLQTGLPSEEIDARIRRFELDAGLTYPSPGRPSDLISFPLYGMRHQVLLRRELADGRERITGAELHELQLCLLTPTMRARQMLDSALAAQGVELRPQVETNSVRALIELVSIGRLAGIAPMQPNHADSLPPGVISIELVEPDVRATVVFTTRADEPVSLLARAMLQTIQHGAIVPVL